MSQGDHRSTTVPRGYPNGEAAAPDVLGSGYHLPPVLSGHNAFWMWGPGRTSSTTADLSETGGMPLIDVTYDGTVDEGVLHRLAEVLTAVLTKPCPSP